MVNSILEPKGYKKESYDSKDQLPINKMIIKKYQSKKIQILLGLTRTLLIE